MSVANVIPLFPNREPVQQKTVAAHMPCPDMNCYSLNKEQKSRGLENLAKVRAQLKEKQLQPLREEGKALQAKGQQSEDAGEKVRITKQMKKLQDQAERIAQRWS